MLAIGRLENSQQHPATNALSLISPPCLAPQLQPIFADLFDEDGGTSRSPSPSSLGTRSCPHSFLADELYKRSPRQYGLPYGKSMPWGAVQDVVRADGDLVLGYMKAGRANLQVARKDDVTLNEGDTLVVLAKE